MSFMSRLDPETREKVRQAKKAERQDSKAVRLQRARIALETATERSRQPRKRDAAYLAWLRRAPCLVCAIRGEVQVMRTDPAHVRRSYPEPGWRPVGGAEKPSDFRCIPACRRCHEEQHEHDNHGWYADLGIYPPEVCAELMRAHLAGADPSEIVEQIATASRRHHAQEGTK